jgi:hypothetical protein
MDIQKSKPETVGQQVAMYQPPALHTQLRQCMAALGNDSQTNEQRQVAKLAYSLAVKQLFPDGKPDYLAVVKYPQIKDLIKDNSEPVVLLLIAVMVRDYCASVNVARNMNEDQILEAAAMLMEEAGNFRLEDYAMMFAQAKRGKLVKVYERIDLSTITDMADAYYAERRDAKINQQEQEIERQEVQAPHTAPKQIYSTPEDRRQGRNLDYRVTSLSGAFSDLKEGLKNKLEDTKGKLNGK